MDTTTKEVRKAFVIENQGEKIFGIIHLPLKNTPNPMTHPPIVLILHGYASTKLGSNRCYVKLAEKLTEKGIACCRFDFRGSGDSEGDISLMGIESFFSDTKVIISYLEKEGFEDISLFGSSLGGSIAILTASRLNIKSLALWAPVASGILWYQDWMVRQKNSMSMITTYQGVEITENFKKEFGQFRADHLMSTLGHIPLLHLQADRDETVSLRHRDAFEKARKEAKASTRFVLYKDSEHQLGRSSAFFEASSEICDWFILNTPVCI